MEKSPRRVRGVSLAVVLGTVLMLLMGGSVSASPEGNKAADGSDASAAEGAEVRLFTDCGPDVRTRITTEDAATSTTGSSFVSFTGSTVFVPANSTRCLLVEFNAETACFGDPGAQDDFCYLRALANGVEMLPVSGGFMAFQSEDFTAESNSTRWVRRVSGGSAGINYSVSLQRRTDGGATQFYLDDWMFSLTLLL